MSKMTKSLVAASVLAATMVSGAAMAEVSMNVGATSNYLWRGWTQSGDNAAVSGGVDYAHDSGVYAGLWTSSLGPEADFAWYGSEVDLYAGWSGEFSGVGVDVGYVAYTYPEMEEAGMDVNFEELYLGGSYDMFSAKVSYDSDNENMYVEAGLDFPLTEDIGLGLHVGSFDFDTGEDYTDYSVTLTKGDVSLMYSDMSENEIYNGTDNGRFSVSWSTSF